MKGTLSIQVKRNIKGQNASHKNYITSLMFDEITQTPSCYQKLDDTLNNDFSLL